MRIELKNIKPQSPLTIPENYFEDLQNRIEKRIEGGYIRLESVERKNIFTLPKNYFEASHTEILEKLKSNLFRISWSAGRTWRVAASILLVSGLFWLTLTKKQLSPEEQKLSQVGEGQIANYLSEQNLSYLDYDNLSMTKTESDSLTIKQLNVSEQEILKHIEEDI